MKTLMIQILLVMLASAGISLAAGSNADENELNKIEQIRNTYYEAIEDESKLDTLRIIIEKEYSKDSSSYPPQILAYLGGLEALKAKHAFWPFTKMSRLNTSMDILQRAIKAAPDNLEIRFIRFSILHHIPSILGYGEERSEDAVKIARLLISGVHPPINEDLKRGIVNFMLESERLSDSIEKQLKNNNVIARSDE